MRPHVYDAHVRFSDVDVYGHVNNVKYFEYYQEARIAMITATNAVKTSKHAARRRRYTARLRSRARRADLIGELLATLDRRPGLRSVLVTSAESHDHCIPSLLTGSQNLPRSRRFNSRIRHGSRRPQRHYHITLRGIA